MSLSRFSLAALFAFSCSAVLAAEPDQAIRQALASLDPDLPIQSIAESPMSGVYQVQLAGGRQLYTSADGQFLLQGYLFQLKDGAVVNLTEAAESQAIGQVIDAIPSSEMVIFPAKERKTHITVFTDTDCGYCQKLHAEVPELNRLGVEVRYVAFPRQGVGSPVAKELESIWCAEDSLEAMNRAKAGKSVAEATCENPVAKQYALGQSIGVNGTPAVVLANGRLIPGYQPAPELAKAALSAK